MVNSEKGSCESEKWFFVVEEIEVEGKKSMFAECVDIDSKGTLLRGIR